MSDRLYNLLPAVYRIRDHAQGYPLRALLAVLDEEVERLEADISGLYDNWFVETCDEWVVPYIGDLLGVRPLLPLREGTFSSRGYVANALSYRSRKGTAAVLEQLARDLTGWPAHAVEFFERLVTTQHVNHPRLHAAATVDLRDARALERTGTPFESAMRLADVRHIDRGRGRHNIPNVGLFVFPLQPQLLTGVSPRPVDERRFFFDPLGLDTPLITVPAAEEDITALSRPLHAPLPISRRALHHDLVGYYGSTEDVRSIRVAVDGVVQPADTIDVCDLSDGAGDTWSHAARPGRISIDPELGRLSFGDAPAGEVTVSYAFGTAGDLGGGAYDRRASLSPFVTDVEWQAGVTVNPPPDDDRVHASLADAVKAWNAQPPGTNGLIVLMDSRTYEVNLTSASARIKVPAGSRLTIAAASWPEEETGDPLNPVARSTGRLVPAGVRPHIRGSISIAGTAASDAAAPGVLVLNGIQLEGSLAVVNGNLGKLHLAHSTLPPSKATFTCGRNPRLRIHIERTVAGGISVAGQAEALQLADSIIDGGIAADDLDVERCTILGPVACRTIQASDSIFVRDVEVERRQVGCVRFSALPLASRTPARYRCHPPAGAPNGGAPVFVSTTFGRPGYATLAAGCPPEIAEGAEDGGEMGGWNFLQAPLRLRNLRLALDEYLRFGLEAGVILAGTAR